jgi:CheY-like chemotaxis protein
VVEDELLIRVMLSDYLQGCGFKVLEGSTADEAVAIIENMDVQIDLVLTDIRMPGSMDGFGLVRWIRANRPDINVIIASGEAKKANVAKELCEDATLFEKPYDLEAVVTKIRATIEDSQTGS